MNTCAKFHSQQFWQYSTPGTYTIRLLTLHDKVQNLLSVVDIDTFFELDKYSRTRGHLLS